jgi:hypothetical protein
MELDARTSINALLMANASVSSVSPPNFAGAWLEMAALLPVLDGLRAARWLTLMLRHRQARQG